MSITEMYESVLEAFKTIKTRRETEQVLETKFYALSSAYVGVTAGVIMGIIVMVFQSASHEVEDNNLMSILLLIGFLALLAFAVWLVYPKMIDKSTPIMDKVMTASITLIICIAGLFAGVYGVFIILAIAICYVMIKILVPMMFKR